jgi:hypothetical protein
VQLKKSQAVLTQAAERAAELLESKRMVDETGRRLKEKKEVLEEQCFVFARAKKSFCPFIC